MNDHIELSEQQYREFVRRTIAGEPYHMILADMGIENAPEPKTLGEQLARSIIDRIESAGMTISEGKTWLSIAIAKEIDDAFHINCQRAIEMAMNDKRAEVLA